MRRWPLLLALVLAVPLVVAGLLGAGLWLRLGAGALSLPPMLSERIEARIDGAMAANRVTIERIDLIRPSDGTQGMDLVLHNVRLSDPDGALRAALPVLTVGLSTEALLRGRVHPVRVDLAGAGLRLARDQDGGIDLALTAGDMASQLSLAETLARLDTMLAAPAFAELEEIAGTGLELLLADAMTGQIMRVSAARLLLTRDKDGVLGLRLGGALEGSRDATLDIVLTRDATTGTTNLGVSFEGLAARDVATIGPVLAWVDLMRAPISGFIGGAILQDGSLGDLRMQLGIGAGQLALAQAAAPVRFDAITAALRYEAATGRITFDQLDLEAPELAFAARGHADLSDNGNRYTAQLRLADISIAPAGLYPAPLHLDGAVLDLRMTLVPDLVVEIGQAVIHHDDIEVRARGRIAARETGLDLAIDATLPEIEVATALAYWPEVALPRTRTWLADNVMGGRLSGVDVALRSAAGDRPDVALTLDFNGVAMRALPNLPPIEAASGYLGLSGPGLILRIDRGQVTAPGGGAVALDGSVMTVADTRPQGPPAVFDLAVEGALPDVLGLLSEPPVRLFRDGAMTPDRLGRGAVALRAEIATRLMRQEGMEGTVFAVSGRIDDFASETLVAGRTLAADSLTIDADPSSVTIAGQARFDGVPFTGSFSRPIGTAATGAARVDARTRVTRDRLAGLGVDLPQWLMAGETDLALTLALTDGAAPVLDLSSDLAGATLSLPQLGWGLSSASTGRLDARLLLGPAPALTRLRLEAAGLLMEGSASLRSDGGLDRLDLDRLRIGGWLDVTGALVSRGAGRMPEVRISGGTVDLRGAPQTGSGAQGGSGGGGPVSARLDRLQVTQGIALTGLVADLTTEGGLSGQFRGQVNGAAPILGTLVATADGPALRIRAEDGGAVLRAAGVFRSAYGGAMELILRATGAEGSYDGTLTISSPRLRGAPVMAELLNLVSVVGLIDQLGGEGINLGSVEARFRLTPTEVIVQEGVAVGPALGLSMDGRYILGAEVLDMAGVISPLNAINGLAGALFSGRREGLFGFAYRLTGPVERPQVTVNPLSILTPGIFRDIFRRPPPTLPETQ
jgi:hypothetical protein